MPPIVKTVYLLCTKSCARFGLNFSIILLCQVKIPDEQNSIHVYLFGKIPVNSSWKIYRLHLLENFRPTVANQSELEVCLYFLLIDKHV